jgi:hypothetical protein
MVSGFPDPELVARHEVRRERFPLRFGPSDGRSRLLPILQSLAEGAWIALAYDAVQVMTGQVPRVGPLELAVLAGFGMAWARRSRWRSSTADVVGGLLLVVLGGALTWVLDPAVRIALVDGNTDAAFALHVPGWVGAVAVARGRTHGGRDDDEDQQDRLLRFGVPLLAVPWLAGHLAASGTLEAAFVSAAFVATLLFAGSAFTALGLARLETVRRMDDDVRSRRSWLLLIGLVALVTTLVGIPLGLLLGVPASALLTTVVGPLRAIFLALIVLTTPLIVVIAAITEFIGSIIPPGTTFPKITLPTFGGDVVDVPSAPSIVFYLAIAVLIILELTAIGLYLWARLRDRREAEAEDLAGFEERSILRPPEAAPAVEAEPMAPPRPRHDPTTATGAYLAALGLLDRDGRWARAGTETPAGHATRARREGLPGGALGRLAVGYEIERYAGRRVPRPERDRLAGRLAALRASLRRTLP